MQFEKSSGLNVDHAHGSMAAMQQSAQEVTDAYKKLLQSIVSTGSITDPVTGADYIPGAKILNTVRDQFTNLENELKNQQQINQGILDSHDKNVKDCNVARRTAFAGAGGVVALKEAMQGARTTHSTCRKEEDTDIESMESECGAFERQQKCDIADQNWYASSSMGQAGTFSNSLQAVIDQAVTCREKVGKVTTQAAQCDGNQDTFKGAFCAYEAKLTETCDALDSCYQTATEHKTQADTSIAKLEAEQKTMWRMVQRVHCYLDLLFKVNTDQGTATMPTQKEIDGCNAWTGDDFKQGDDTIGLGYDKADAKEACLEHDDNSDDGFSLAGDDYKPGTSGWYNGELVAYEAHGKLKDNSQCE